MEDLLTLTGSRAEPRGVAIFAKGFRAFFVLAALHAIVMIPLWLFFRAGAVTIEGSLLPTVWHGHEMVFGFATAVVAGFLLTAASNWTKRETASGGWLAALCLVWLAGRAAMLVGPRLPPIVVAVTCLAFLPLLAFAVGRPIVLSRSTRNYGIVVALLGLWLAQLLTHAGALSGSILWQTAGPKVGVGLVIVLILVIGGRIIPLFTRNTTKAEDIRSLPWLDRIAIGGAVATLLADALSIGGWPFAAAAGVTAIASAARALHWGTRRSLSDPLLWVLHLGYAFVPLGFALRAIAVFVPRVADSTAQHALTVGAIGTLTLGMMARVALGHTGRPLKAPPSLAFAFGAMILAALARVIGPIVGGAVETPMIHVAGTAWTLAFAIYLVRLGPLLFRPRPDGRPG